MALTTIDFDYPDIIMPSGGAVAYAASIALNGTGDFQGFVCQAKESITITSVGMRVASRTGSPGNVATGLRLGIAYVDATTGFPATTPVWANATFSGAAGTAYQDFNATTGVTTSQMLIATLTTAVTISRGTVFAILMDPVSGTWATGTELGITPGLSAAGPNIQTPYSYGMTGSTFALNAVAAPNFLYRSSTTTYGYPYETITSLNINSGSTPDEVGMYFRLPSGVCSTFQVSSVRIGMLPSGQDFDVILYDTNGTTVLQTVTVDGNILNTTAHGVVEVEFSGTIATLTAGSYYRLVVRPATATNMGAFQYYTFRTDNDKTAFLNNAADVQYTSRTNAGAWTENTNQIMTMQAVITAMDPGTSSGGLKTHPGMSGGLRG